MPSVVEPRLLTKQRSNKRKFSRTRSKWSHPCGRSVLSKQTHLRGPRAAAAAARSLVNNESASPVPVPAYRRRVGRRHSVYGICAREVTWKTANTGVINSKLDFNDDAYRLFKSAGRVWRFVRWNVSSTALTRVKHGRLSALFGLVPFGWKAAYLLLYCTLWKTTSGTYDLRFSANWGGCLKILYYGSLSYTSVMWFVSQPKRFRWYGGRRSGSAINWIQVYSVCGNFEEFFRKFIDV